MERYMSFYQETGFHKQEWKSGIELRNAFDTARNRHGIRRGTPQLLQYAYGCYLFAVNRHGRIKWGKALCEQFSEYFDLNPERPYPLQPLFFVTLVDVECSTTHDAKIQDVETFKRKLRVGLRGLSYVGMMEPAYYVNIAKGARYTGKRGVFWHIHAICLSCCRFR